jgi:type VI secretion system protein ImpA
MPSIGGSFNRVPAVTQAMASQDVLALDKLLAPIPGDKPTGVDLRADANPASDYYKLKDARFAARAKERDLESQPEAVDLLPEWRTILDLAPKILAEQAKDLEVAAWFVEALIRRHGFAGLRDGFRLARGLVEKYWDGLYPPVDEEGIAAKVAPLTALNGEGTDGTLIQPIRKVPLTDGKEPGPFATWQYEQARSMAMVTDEKAKAWHLKAGTATMDQIESSRRATKPKFFVDLVDDLKQCQQEFVALNAALDKACGADAPPASTIRNTLEAVTAVAMELGKDALAAAQLAAAGAAAATGNGAGAAGDGAAAAKASTAPGLMLGPIRTREDAFAALLRVGEFFRSSEPHSPLSYSLEELVRRGRMTLPELLAELIKDGAQRKTFFTVAGMKPPEDEKGQKEK